MEEAAGNPFFIRLLCSHLNGSLNNSHLTQTITEVLGRRLDQLSDNARRVLELTVILGKHCTFDRIESVLEMRRLELLSAIEELDDRALVRIGDDCFVNSHALLVEPVTSRMAKTVLRALHAAAARALQRDAGDSPGGSLPWDCAEHWRLANEPEEAVNILRTCAQRALEIGRPMDAYDTLRRALDLPVRDYSTRLDLLERTVLATEYSAHYSPLPELFEEVKRVRATMNRAAVEHDMLEFRELTLHYHLDGDPRASVSRLQECTRSPAASPSHRIAAAMQLIMTGELTLGPELAHAAYISIREEGLGTIERDMCDVTYHTCFGNAADAIAAARVVVRKGFAGLPTGLRHVLSAGYAQSRIGDPDEARETLLRGYDAAKVNGSYSAEGRAALHLAMLSWNTGQLDETKIWFRRFLHLRGSHPQDHVIGDSWIIGARLATREGRLDEAMAMIEQARQTRQADVELPKLLIGSCEIQLRIAAGQPPCTDNELAELLSLHDRARTLSGQDDVVLALVEALEYFGNGVKARRLLKSYVTGARRDGFPLLQELAARINSSRQPPPIRSS
jgi:tetratricopeptide (TPR) repeat protein